MPHALVTHLQLIACPTAPRSHKPTACSFNEHNFLQQRTRPSPHNAQVQLPTQLLNVPATTKFYCYSFKHTPHLHKLLQLTQKGPNFEILLVGLPESQQRKGRNQLQ